MKFKKNLESVEIDYHEESDPQVFALWYKQFLGLPEKTKKEIIEKALIRIQDTKPDTYQFIKKFKCELVGVSPRLEYSMPKSQDGDVTWIHSFSMPTLLYWCPEGGFAFMVNANLDYNDTVLNRQKGNRKEGIKGFTA